MTPIIRTGLIALLVFTPLAFGSVEVWAVSVVEFIAFGLTGLWLFQLGFGRGSAGLPPGPVWIIPVLFAGWGLIQLLAGTSVFPHGTREALLLGTAYGLIFGLTASAFRTEKEIGRLALVLVLVGFGVALFAIIQRYAWNGRMYGLRQVRESGAVFGPFVNRNHFAGYMEMVIPLSIGYIAAALTSGPARGETAGRRFVDWMTSERANQRVLLLFLTLVMSVSLVLSFSRAGIVSFLTALVLIGALLAVGGATRRWVRLPGILAAFVLISLVWFGLGPLVDRYETLLYLHDDASMQGRIKVWRDTARMTADHPVMGTGLGTFGAVYPAYKTTPDPVFYAHAHNDYVQLLAEAGGIGFGLATGTFGIMVGFILAGWRVRKNPRAKAMLAGILTGMAALLIHGMNDFNFHIPANALLFIVLTALAWNLSRSDRPGEAPEAGAAEKRPFWAAAGLVVIAFVMVQTTMIFLADRHYHAGLKLEKAGRFGPAGKEYRRAIRWDGGDPAYRIALGRIDERRGLDGDAAGLASARSEMERAAAIAPTMAAPHLHLGWIAARNGDAAAATEEFDRVLSLDPTNPHYQRYVGLWYAATGRTDDALRLAKELRAAGRPGPAAEIEEKLKKT
jgi:O-antigen ligase